MFVQILLLELRVHSLGPDLLSLNRRCFNLASKCSWLYLLICVVNRLIHHGL